VLTDPDAESGAEARTFRWSNHARKIVPADVPCGTESVTVVAKAPPRGSAWGRAMVGPDHGFA